MPKLISSAIFAFMLIATSSVAAQDLSSDERRLFDLVNEARMAHGIDPVQVDEGLAAVARSHSLDMARNRFFSHQSPTTGSMGDRLNTAGVPFRQAGENIAFDIDVHSAHRSLMTSEQHRHNVLNPQYTHLGIGIVRVGESILVTQAFMRPQQSAGTVEPPTPAPAVESLATEEPAVPAGPGSEQQTEVPLDQEHTDSPTETPQRQLLTPFGLLEALTSPFLTPQPARPTPQGLPADPLDQQSGASPQEQAAPPPESTQTPGIYIINQDGTARRINLDAANLMRILGSF